LVAYIITEISHLYPKKYEIFSIFKCAVEFSAALEFTFSSQPNDTLLHCPIAFNAGIQPNTMFG